MPFIPRTGGREMIDETNVLEQVPPFWGLIEDNLLPLAVVLLASGAAAGFASKWLSAQYRRSRKVLGIVGWVLCVLAMMAFVALILEGIGALWRK